MPLCHPDPSAEGEGSARLRRRGNGFFSRPRLAILLQNDKRGDQRGFTLIELVMAMGVAAIIMVAASYSILQVLNMNTRNTNYMTAVRHAQTAGYWVTRDVEMASADNVSVPSATPLALGRRSDPSTWHTTSHSLDTGTGTLWRTEDGQTTRIVDHVSGSFTRIPGSGNPTMTVRLDVTATVTSRGITGRETRTYEANPRPRLGN